MPNPATTRTWHRLALVGILLLALFLHFFRLDQEKYANQYYAAAVKSQLTSWHNFFFNSFDPGGFVTVDKPPLGLWVQTASAALFGFNGVSLLLPQAVARRPAAARHRLAGSPVNHPRHLASGDPRQAGAIGSPTRPAIRACCDS